MFTQIKVSEIDALGYDLTGKNQLARAEKLIEACKKLHHSPVTLEYTSLTSGRVWVITKYAGWLEWIKTGRGKSPLAVCDRKLTSFSAQPIYRLVLDQLAGCWSIYRTEYAGNVATKHTLLYDNLDYDTAEWYQARLVSLAYQKFGR